MAVFKVMFVKENAYSLLNIRLWFYSLALVNLLVTAYVTLITIDLSVEEDPKVRAYSRTRWLLLTCWYNMALLFYIPLCLYCDWQQKIEGQTQLVDQLMKLRDLLMTSVLLPVTSFSGIIFLILYSSYRWVMAPARIFELVPGWFQHSLHSVAVAFVIMDLVLTPRQRPKSDKNNLVLLYGFSFFYTFVMFVSYFLGARVYAFLETASRIVCILTFLGSLFIVTVCYYAQWLLIDSVWGQKRNNKSKYKNLYRKSLAKKITSRSLAE